MRHAVEGVLAGTVPRSIPSAGPPVDIRTGILNRMGELSEPDAEADERQLIAGLLRSFTVTGGQLLTELERAMWSGDHEAGQATAHRLKGSAANLGVDAVAQACAALEDQLRAGPITDAEFERLLRLSRAGLDQAEPHLAAIAAELESPEGMAVHDGGR